MEDSLQGRIIRSCSFQVRKEMAELESARSLRNAEAGREQEGVMSCSVLIQASAAMGGSSSKRNGGIPGCWPSHTPKVLMNSARDETNSLRIGQPVTLQSDCPCVTATSGNPKLLLLGSQPSVMGMNHPLMCALALCFP